MGNWFSKLHFLYDDNYK